MSETPEMPDEMHPEKPDLHQCPCEPATKCLMDEPCLGCETYAEWLERSGYRPDIIAENALKHYKEMENDIHKRS